MNNEDFLSGLVDDDDKFEEQVAAAEHLLRLKIQTGYQSESEIEKEAAFNWNTAKDYLATRPALRSAAIGAGATGAVGAVQGAMNDPRGSVHGAISGGAKGAVAGGAGGLAFHHLQNKLGSIQDVLKQNIPHMDPKTLMTMGLGAAAGGILTHVGSKPREALGGKSKDEVRLQAEVEGSKLHPENGLMQKLRNRGLEHRHGIAQAFKEHPGKATAVGSVVGAGAGYGLAKLLKFVADKAKSGVK
jgi:hypothetical protein